MGNKIKKTMKFFATLAIAAAVRLQSEEGPTAEQIWKEFNTDNNGVLDYKEVTSCITKHKVPAKTQKKIGNALLKKASIPKSNWKAVAAGVSKFTGGKVSAKDALKEMKACNKNGDKKLSYREAKICLGKNAKALGLNSKKKW